MLHGTEDQALLGTGDKIIGDGFVIWGIKR